MPSRAYTSFLLLLRVIKNFVSSLCQCPLGLIPHFYRDPNNGEVYSDLLCQCPLGLLLRLFCTKCILLFIELL